MAFPEEKFTLEDTKQALLDYGNELNFVKYGIMEAPLINFNSTRWDVLSGYIALIKAYINSYEGEHKELKEFCSSLKNNFKYSLNVLPQRGHFVSEIFTDINNKKQAYIYFSSHESKHINLIKFFKDKDKYYFTIYNAGAYITDEQRQISTTYDTTKEYLGTSILSTK